MTQRTTISTVLGSGKAVAAGVAALLLATACVSAPTGEGETSLVETTTSSIPGYTGLITTQDYEYVSKEIPVELELAWGVLPGIYQELGIPVATSDPTKRMVANPGFEVQRIAGSRMNRWLNCGTSRTGPMANAYQVTLTVQTELKEIAEGTTEVKSLVKGTAINRSTAGYQVSCKSRETLEEVIADKVAEALGAG